MIQVIMLPTDEKANALWWSGHKLYTKSPEDPSRGELNLTIKKIKESWSREEVIELFKKYQYDYAQWVLKMENDINGKPIPLEWISENL